MGGAGDTKARGGKCPAPRLSPSTPSLGSPSLSLLLPRGPGYPLWQEDTSPRLGGLPFLGQRQERGWPRAGLSQLRGQLGCPPATEAWECRGPGPASRPGRAASSEGRRPSQGQQWGKGWEKATASCSMALSPGPSGASLGLGWDHPFGFLGPSCRPGLTEPLQTLLLIQAHASSFVPLGPRKQAGASNQGQTGE